MIDKGEIKNIKESVEVSRQRISEEWYEETKEMTMDKLPEFLRKLTEDYEHDYETICHAIAAGAIATAWAINSTPQGGITGFQAGCIMWMFIRHWTYSHNKLGLRIIDYDNLLYPQYEEKFQKTITPAIWEELQNEVKKLLDSGRRPADAVYEHWLRIANGEVPFGLTICAD